VYVQQTPPLACDALQQIALDCAREAVDRNDVVLLALCLPYVPTTTDDSAVELLLRDVVVLLDDGPTIAMLPQSAEIAPAHHEAQLAAWSVDNAAPSPLPVRVPVSAVALRFETELCACAVVDVCFVHAVAHVDSTRTACAH
jgi:hypothetical protein